MYSFAWQHTFLFPDRSFGWQLYCTYNPATTIIRNPVTNAFWATLWLRWTVLDYHDVQVMTKYGIDEFSALWVQIRAEASDANNTIIFYVILINTVWWYRSVFSVNDVTIQSPQWTHTITFYLPKTEPCKTGWASRLCRYWNACNIFNDSTAFSWRKSENITRSNFGAVAWRLWGGNLSACQCWLLPDRIRWLVQKHLHELCIFAQSMRYPCFMQ